jgi:hypothetical protein
MAESDLYLVAKDVFGGDIVLVPGFEIGASHPKDSKTLLGGARTRIR